MKDEIKEILDKCTPFLFGDEVDKLTNYITNLKEELEGIKDNFKILLEYDEELEKENKEYERRFNNLKKEYIDKSDYTHRLIERTDKALEINKKLQNIGILDSRAVLWLSQQENILNGGDEE